MSKIAQDANFRDPKNIGPRASPTMPNGGTLSVFSTFTTKRPPSEVHESLIDWQNWHRWGTFVRKCTITHPTDPLPEKLHVDCKMTLGVQMTPSFSTNSKEIVVQVDPPPTKPGEVCTVRWVIGEAFVPGAVLNAERVNEIEMTEDGGTVYRTWEVFGGVVSNVIRWVFGSTLRDRFQDWSLDLQKYVEAGGAGGVA